MTPFDVVYYLAKALVVFAFILIAAAVCTGCEQVHRVALTNGSVETPYAVTGAEYDGESVVLFLAADFSGENVVFLHNVDGSIEFRADYIGANRSAQLEALPAVIEAFNGRVTAYEGIVDSIVETLLKAGLPIP